MIQVIPAKNAHAALLAEIHKAATVNPWDAEGFAAFLEKPTIHALLVMDKDEPLGFVLAQQAADEAEILMIAVHPKAQRKGVGECLLVSVAKQIQSDGVSALFLEVAEDNAPARALYDRCGFGEMGRRKNYYVRDGKEIDALLLRLELSKP